MTKSMRMMTENPLNAETPAGRLRSWITPRPPSFLIHCSVCPSTKGIFSRAPGVDIAYFIMTTRRICHLLGITPQYIQDTSHSHSATMNQMWVKDDEWIDTLQWQEEEAQAEIPTLRVPLEKEGAEIMYSVIGPEPKFQAQLLYLDSADPNKDIQVYFNSPGGAVHAGLGIYDTMQYTSCDVANICTGMAATTIDLLISTLKISPK